MPISLPDIYNSVYYAADSVSLGLSSTAGLVQVLAFNQSSPGGSIAPSLQDYVGWSKTATTGAQTLPSSTSAFLERQPVDSQNNPSINTPGAGSWLGVQPDSTNPCNLVAATGSPTNIPTGLSELLPGTEPPVTIINSAGGAATQTAGLPSADVGLMAPSVNELLPNPNGTGNDSTDEFIELYNPNIVNFDLSGFGLQAGSATVHNFTFPAGVSLPAKSFTAFYSADTGLSLSNSGGQAKLFDPFGNSISATSVYGTAKDGQAWALAKGKWYWTTNVTPGAANIINQPASGKKSSASSKSPKTSSKVKGAKTAKKTKAILSGSNSSSDVTNITPIHPWALVLVASLALLYGAYEYRTDLANRIYQFRRYFRARRADGAQTAGRRGD